MNFPFNIYLPALLVPCALAFALLPLWCRWCVRSDLVDEPGHRKDHGHVTPLAGGLTVFSALAITALAGAAFILLRVGDTTTGLALSHGLSRRAMELGAILFGAFGIVGGFVQAQAHVQFVSHLADKLLDPQAALDRPRFMVEGDVVRLERGLWNEAERLANLGYRVVKQPNHYPFGGGQAVMVLGDLLIGGSDSRKDGIACGF